MCRYGSVPELILELYARKRKPVNGKRIEALILDGTKNQLPATAALCP
jgi:hypothetical protein